jgi:hypothetical protein
VPTACPEIVGAWLTVTGADTGGGG